MLILDKDGNLTKVWEEGAPFVLAYAKCVAQLVGKPLEEVLAQLQEYTARALREDPAEFGWRFGKDDLIMAPAQVDPYLQSNAAARRYLDDARVFTGQGPLNNFLDLIFSFAYGKTANVPKPETRLVLKEIAHDELPAWIVSNSGTSGVKSKLAAMFGDQSPDNLWWESRTFGNARKMDPDEYDKVLPDGTPITTPEDKVLWGHVDGLVDRKRYSGAPRDTIIKRPHYLKRLIALKALWERRLGRVARWSEVLVVGDIFELDLALPLELGCHVGFMCDEYAPQWEIEFVDQYPYGRILRSPVEILPYYTEIQAAHAY